MKNAFPNQFNIYIHDTPSKSKFTRDSRYFSHGCIRLQNPFDLAEKILGLQGISREEINQIARAGKKKIVKLKKWTYIIRFDNTGTFSAASESVIDPLDIQVHNQDGTPVKMGRVYSNEWRINAHNFSESAATDAAFYVLTPTGETPSGTSTDYTWKLKFAGLAGYVFEVAGNNIGLPKPNSDFSEDQTKTMAPVPLYKVYLNVPEIANGGGNAPLLDKFKYAGASDWKCDCIPASKGSFNFESNVVGTYEVVIDLDKDGKFNTSSGDILLKGDVKKGTNSVFWDGKDGNQKAVAASTYDVQLSVRLGELHFVGRDIETSKEGLRIFGVDPPELSTTPTSAKMFWNDTRINDYLSPDHETHPGKEVPLDQKVNPAETISLLKA